MLFIWKVPEDEISNITKEEMDNTFEREEKMKVHQYIKLHPLR